MENTQSTAREELLKAKSKTKIVKDFFWRRFFEYLKSKEHRLNWAKSGKGVRWEVLGDKGGTGLIDSMFLTLRELVRFESKISWGASSLTGGLPYPLGGFSLKKIRRRIEREAVIMQIILRRNSISVCEGKVPINTVGKILLEPSDKYTKTERTDPTILLVFEGNQ